MNTFRHQPRKRFGQNFLRDQAVIARIFAAADIGSGDCVLEIGPGTGALTRGLLQRAHKVVIMELDRDLVAFWRQDPAENLEVLAGDALTIDWNRLAPLAPLKLVANLPYNISSQILFRIIENRRLFSRLVLMFQKEVGDRLLAEPGTRHYGILSVCAQLWFNIRRVCHVPPQAFRPAPKVDSTVLLFEPLGSPRVEVQDFELFDRLVRGAFRQRRKTLRNSLMGAGFAAEHIDAALAAAGIDPTRRGETLTLDEFSQLTQIWLRTAAG
ncbi:MAG: 16S rRNA (adenine(1518)-N(6)/adenine(1519)-N(6))-dimethyltransferase RsmA [Deltaproteobacteria bacterium]|nr:MAG: 16S rRNA (adenine(1518)-N(6)/adenine(1519)-N(6))-dimethyltransferase RsmA [Deltaproteobacteria bacterium]